LSDVTTEKTSDRYSQKWLSIGREQLALHARDLTDYGMTHILMDKGRHVLEAYATDQAGNVSDVVSVRVEIDRTEERK
jgi:hypothetical protein